MSKFDFMGFGYDGGRDEMFVAHAKKYSAKATARLCEQEYSHLFRKDNHENKRYREPRPEDAVEGYCAFRFGVDNGNYPDGCYTFVNEGEPGAFLVWVIKFDDLKVMQE